MLFLGLPGQSRNLDTLQAWKQGGDVKLAMRFDDFRRRHGQCFDQVSVVINAKVCGVLRTIDAGLGIFPVMLSPEKVIISGLPVVIDEWTFGGVASCTRFAALRDDFCVAPMHKVG